MGTRSIKLYIASSLDGFIATGDGGVEWLDDESLALEGEDFGYFKFYESIDTTLMGNGTYREVLGFDVPFPYPDKKNYVFTRNRELKNDDNVEYVHSDPVAFVKDLLQQDGKDIWLVGGGQLNTLLLEQGLIHQMIITIIPTTLGKGIPMFTAHDAMQQWQLVDQVSYKNGMVKLTYNKK